MECSRELGENKEAKLQELLAFITLEGGMEPEMIMNAIVFCFSSLRRRMGTTLSQRRLRP